MTRDPNAGKKAPDSLCLSDRVVYVKRGTRWTRQEYTTAAEAEKVYRRLKRQAFDAMAKRLGDYLTEHVTKQLQADTEKEGTK